MSHHLSRKTDLGTEKSKEQPKNKEKIHGRSPGFAASRRSASRVFESVCAVENARTRSSWRGLWVFHSVWGWGPLRGMSFRVSLSFRRDPTLSGSRLWPLGLASLRMEESRKKKLNPFFHIIPSIRTPFSQNHREAQSPWRPQNWRDSKTGYLKG